MKCGNNKVYECNFRKLKMLIELAAVELWRVRPPGFTLNFV